MSRQEPTPTLEAYPSASSTTAAMRVRTESQWTELVTLASCMRIQLRAMYQIYIVSYFLYFFSWHKTNIEKYDKIPSNKETGLGCDNGRVMAPPAFWKKHTEVTFIFPV